MPLQKTRLEDLHHRLSWGGVGPKKSPGEPALLNIPGCVGGMEVLSGPKGAALAGSPMAAAARTSSKTGDLVRIHLDHSRGLLPWVDPHSNSPVPSARSTAPRGCSREGREAGAGLGRKEAKDREKKKSFQPLESTTSFFRPRPRAPDHR